MKAVLGPSAEQHLLHPWLLVGVRADRDVDDDGGDHSLMAGHGCSVKQSEYN